MLSSGELTKNFVRVCLADTICFNQVWLIALDQTILAPALPVIASRFNALSELSWIASAYFLTQCAFLLLYGQILTLFDRRMTFMCAIVTFEVGSIICAAAPTVNVLIFGRAFSGCGAAGIFVAVLSIVAEVTRLEDRPKLLGLFGGVFAVSSIIGPLLGTFGVSNIRIHWLIMLTSAVSCLVSHQAEFSPIMSRGAGASGSTCRSVPSRFLGVY